MLDRKIIATLSNLRHQMGLLRVTKFADLHIMDPRYTLCEDTVKILQYCLNYCMLYFWRNTMRKTSLRII